MNYICSGFHVVLFQHVNAERVLLVAAHVGITHEVQNVLVTARRRGSEVQLDPGFSLQCQSFDGQ